MNKILFVKGAKNSCILDLRQKYALIYHIEFEEKDAFTLPKVPTGIFIIFEKDYETFCLSKDSNNSFAKLIEKLQPLNKLDDNVISPKFAWIEITEKCNYHCIHCYGSYLSKGQNISKELFERAVAYGNLVSDSSESIILKWKECAKLTKNNIQVCEDCEYRLICFDCRPNRGKANFLSKPWNCSYNPYVGMFPKATKELI